MFESSGSMMQLIVAPYAVSVFKLTSYCGKYIRRFCCGRDLVGFGIDKDELANFQSALLSYASVARS